MLNFVVSLVSRNDCWYLKLVLTSCWKRHKTLHTPKTSKFTTSDQQKYSSWLAHRLEETLFLQLPFLPPSKTQQVHQQCVKTRNNLKRNRAQSAFFFCSSFLFAAVDWPTVPTTGPNRNSTYKNCVSKVEWFLTPPNAPGVMELFRRLKLRLFKFLKLFYLLKKHRTFSDN